MAIGAYRHRVTLSAPAPPVPDAGGGYTETPWAPLNPAKWNCAIGQASGRTLESIGAGTVTAQASHVIRGRYHPGITTETRITFGARLLSVVFVANPDERNIETIVVAVELVR
jgi:head-tail adaptor